MFNSNSIGFLDRLKYAPCCLIMLWPPYREAKLESQLAGMLIHMRRISQKSD